MRNYLIYGLIGWCLEIIWTGLGSLLFGDPRLTATTYLWMFPIYGIAVLLEPVHDFIRSWPILKRGLLWMVIFFGVEYLTGWILRITVGTSPWNYSGALFQLNGLIRLDYAPVWFILGLLYEKLHDWLQRVKIR